MNGTCEFLPVDNKYQTKAIHSADDEKHYPYPVVQAISLSTTFHQADPSQPKVKLIYLLKNYLFNTLNREI